MWSGTLWQAATCACNASVDGAQRELKPGEKPSDRIDAKEKQKQGDEEEHVVKCAHNHLAGGNQHGGKLNWRTGVSLSTGTRRVGFLW
jgi:hypothetical protein